MKRFYKQEMARLVKLAFPILVTQLIMMGMSVVDTLMAGQVSASDLAAVALGSSLVMPLIFFCQGTLLAVTPIIANHYGAKRYRHIRRTLMQSLWLALILSILAKLISMQLYHLCALMSHDKHLIDLANKYINFLSWGIFGACFYQAWRGINEGVGNTRIIMIFGLIGIFLNIPINYIFIHGLYGMPKLGGAGCGVATALVFTFMAISLASYVYCCKRYKPLKLLHIRMKPRKDRVLAIAKLGIPIAFSIFFETSLFSVITILMAPFGTNTVAAHQVAINFIGVIFMVPLSIGMTMTIRIGHLLGQRQLEQARKIGILGIGVCLLIALITATLTLLFRPQIVALYTDNQQVQVIAVRLLLVGAAFQLSDALQVVIAGVLRGYQDTRSVLWITFISYWPIGLGSGCILGMTDWLTPEPLGAIGFWLAFMFGLSCAAVMLLIRFWRLSHHYEKWNQPINVNSKIHQTIQPPK